ncbi:MAG: hypothetical protein WA709_37645 [Stellaceae bacterium]
MRYALGGFGQRQEVGEQRQIVVRMLPRVEKLGELLSLAQPYRRGAKPAACSS